MKQKGFVVQCMGGEDPVADNISIIIFSKQR